DFGVELGGRFRTGRRQTADYLGCVADAKHRVSRIDSFGTERKIEINAGSQAGPLKDWSHDLLCRAWPRRRLENDKLAVVQMGRDVIRRSLDCPQIRTPLAAQGRRYTYDDDIGFGD